MAGMGGPPSEWRDLDGDDLVELVREGGASVEALEATGSLSGPTASEGDTVTVPSNPDVVPIYFDATTGEPLVPDLEETV